MCEECGFSELFNIGLKRHKTLLHNLGREETFKCKDCANPATKYDEKKIH